MKDKIEPVKTPGALGFDDLCAADQALVEKTIADGCSRRDVMKLMAVTGVTLATAQNLLGTGGEAMAMTPKKGGSIRMASSLHGPDDQLDPALFTSTIDYTRGRATYNSLVQHANDLTPQPELAESFTPNKDATEWTFKLRKDVRWHDGSKFTPEDAVYSMNRHLTEDSTSVIKAVLSSVKEWKKTGPNEIKAIMNSPNSDLPTLLGVYQAKIIKEGSKGDGMGTGPYKMESFEPGVKSIHSRNDDYWREGANLDSIEITAITDPVARSNALISGDMQLVTQVDPKAIRQVEAAPGVRVSSIPAGTYMGICCLTNTAPGNNPDFVKGMQYIQDRKRIVKRILKGHGTLGNDQPINAAYGTDFCSELPQREFDPDKAKFHFKKSGVDSAEVYSAPVVAGIEEAVLLAQTNCAKIGFDLKVKKVPTDGYWGAVWMVEPVNVVTWNMRPTANSMMAIGFAPGAAWNDTYWNNPRMGELLTRSLSETDPDKRHAMYCEMQTLIHNECGMVIPAHVNILDGVSERVQGLPTVPLGQLGACEWPEFAWLSS
ncbi:MAG: ABC transporter substrate-binding protein [Gammaproteobacteria bacterium]|nr:ABC transporter substrate-binding protein [Gammaproteobacteria bacterium]